MFLAVAFTQIRPRTTNKCICIYIFFNCVSDNVIYTDTTSTHDFDILRACSLRIFQSVVDKNNNRLLYVDKYYGLLTIGFEHLNYTYVVRIVSVRSLCNGVSHRNAIKNVQRKLGTDNFFKQMNCKHFSFNTKKTHDL